MVDALVLAYRYWVSPNYSETYWSVFTDRLNRFEDHDGLWKVTAVKDLKKNDNNKNDNNKNDNNKNDNNKNDNNKNDNNKNDNNN